MADLGSTRRVITQIFGKVFQTLGQVFGLPQRLDRVSEKLSQVFERVGYV